MLYFLYEILLRFDRNGEIQLIGELLVKFNCHDCNLNDDWLDFGLTYDWINLEFDVIFYKKLLFNLIQVKRYTNDLNFAHFYNRVSNLLILILLAKMFQSVNLKYVILKFMWSWWMVVLLGLFTFYRYCIVNLEKKDFMLLLLCIRNFKINNNIIL